MKRLSISVLILVLAVVAAGCSPRAVLEDGSVVAVRQWILADAVVKVEQGNATIRNGNLQLDLAQATEQYSLPAMTSLIDSATDFMETAEIDSLKIAYTGEGIFFWLNGEAFPGLAIPKGSLQTSAEVGFTASENMGSSVSPELQEQLRTTVVPLLEDLLASINASITFEFSQ